MKTEKTTGEATTGSAAAEPLVLKPEWMVDHPKEVEKLHTFSVTFNEKTKRIDLTVNGDEYRSRDTGLDLATKEFKWGKSEEEGEFMFTRINK